MKIKTTLLLYLLLLSQIHSQQNWYDNNILSLTDENILQHLGQDTHIILKFYTPWCYYCKQMNKEYIALDKYFQDNKQVVVAKVDCQKQESICMFYDIHSYPQVAYFRPKSVNIQAKYQGDRTFQKMKKWVEILLQRSPVGTPQKMQQKDDEDSKYIYILLLLLSL